MRNSDRMSIVTYNVYVIISLLASFFCLLKESGSSMEKPLFLLPLSYGLALVICRNLRTLFLSLSVILINSVCLIRYSLYPITLILEGNTLFTSEAIYLMIYEIITVLLFLNLYSKRIRNAKSFESNIRKHNKLGKLNLLLIVSTIILGAIFPSLFSIFIFWGREQQSISGLISMTFALGIIVAYVFLISKISNWERGGRWAFLLSLLISIAYIYVTSFEESNVHRWKFLSVGIPTIYVLVVSFPRYRKIILNLSISMIVVSIILGSFIKFSIEEISIGNFFSQFITSDSLDAYFGGLNGITNALTLLKGNPFAESARSTLTDFFGNMPIMSRFFDTDQYSTQALFLDAIGRTDLICPLLAQSVLHFGVFGAPILSIIMATIAVEGDCYARKAKTVYSLYGGIMLCVVFSIFMCLNTTILLPNAWKLLLFFVIQYFNENKI